ncbi:hypothetical protein [Haematobacter sp. UBA3484]|uniref:hypothetical protein n=1 Tax=Haematobacter sp. UBA3484 TaxID=1946582 RepID=UPI0025C4F734|nr:hypothetical protein [Haematobacter sp. UBA3484]
MANTTMDIETYTAEVFGAHITCLRNPDQYPVHNVRGDYLNASGFLDGRGIVALRVTPDGRAWTSGQFVMEAEDLEVICERWSDGDRIGNFAPDMGEFERCGIVPILCGSAQNENR